MWFWVLGWLNVALAQTRPGLSHEAQLVPKWLADAEWHDAHDFDEGWTCAHEEPGFLWHEPHDTG